MVELSDCGWVPGMIIRGLAPLSLALAILEEQGDKIVLTNWAETDFRTGLKPWWN
jgi:cytochrome b6-f complex iron-sulfur subunit